VNRNRRRKIMATTTKPAATDTPTSTPDPVGKAVEPVKATVLDIPANEPYPTGNPPQPTHAEINGLTPAKGG
jgi:hypothetical protein